MPSSGGGTSAHSAGPSTLRCALHPGLTQHPSTAGSQTLLQRLVGLWSAQLARLAAHGDRGAYLAFARVYHLMASPAMLFNPAVIFSTCRAAVRGMPEVNPRPRALNALAANRSG
jgi:hypothetical protein